MSLLDRLKKASPPLVAKLKGLADVSILGRTIDSMKTVGTGVYNQMQRVNEQKILKEMEKIQSENSMTFANTDALRNEATKRVEMRNMLEGAVVGSLEAPKAIGNVVRSGGRIIDAVAKGSDNLDDLALTLRGTKGMTADDIMKTYPNIQLKKDVPATTIDGTKTVIPQGEKLTPYELTGNKILLQDGETYIVSKNQYQNIKGQSIVAEGKPFAPELEGLEETVKGSKNDGWKGNSLMVDNQEVATLSKNKNGTWSYTSDFSEGSVEFKTKDEAMQEAENAIVYDPYTTVGTKFEEYTLPNGKNYKEILIKAPENKVMTKAEAEEMELLARRMNNEINFSEKDLQRYNELNRKSADRIDNNFKSSHWDEPNVLAHLRLNERTYKGKKVTFMEELQSDWAREARAGKTTANNPLLKNWQELSIKRALKEAVDNNSEYLAWTTGEQQAARYSLAKQVDEVSIQPSREGANNVYVQAYKDGREVIDKAVPKENLGGLVGKDLAEKYLFGEGGHQVYKGQQLEIGGEWAYNLYDKQVKNIVQNLTGGKVEVIDLGIPIKYETEWKLGSTDKLAKINDLKVGTEVYQVGNSKIDYIITDILGDGKFKAVPKSLLDNAQIGEGLPRSIGKNREEALIALSKNAETFDISTKTTTQQAIKLTPEIKAKIKGLAPKIETSGKQFMK